MKVQITEFDGAFGIDSEPESMAELATLVRMGMNGTRDITLQVMVNRPTASSAYICVAKKRRTTNTVR